MDSASTPCIYWARVGGGEARRGQQRWAEARAALETALPQLKDKDARDRAEELLRKLPPAAAVPPAPAADGNPG